jgi:hypothetical protein
MRSNPSTEVLGYCQSSPRDCIRTLVQSCVAAVKIVCHKFNAETQSSQRQRRELNLGHTNHGWASAPFTASRATLFAQSLNQYSASVWFVLVQWTIQ